MQVLKSLVLGEEERGQSQYQVMCFITKFQKSDFISSDAMAKLRQVINWNCCQKINYTKFHRGRLFIDGTSIFSFNFEFM